MAEVKDQDEWSLLTTYKRDVDKLDWKFAGDAPGAGKIYVRTRAADADTDAIYQYDIGKKALEEPASRPCRASTWTMR